MLQWKMSTQSINKNIRENERSLIRSKPLFILGGNHYETDNSSRVD